MPKGHSGRARQIHNCFSYTYLSLVIAGKGNSDVMPKSSQARWFLRRGVEKISGILQLFWKAFSRIRDSKGRDIEETADLRWLRRIKEKGVKN